MSHFDPKLPHKTFTVWSTTCWSNKTKQEIFHNF